MSRKKYQTECDADFPDVLLIDRAKRDREGRSGRDEDAEAETQKEDPVPGPQFQQGAGGAGDARAG